MLVTIAALLGGCVPLVYPFPPPALSAASLDAVPEGAIELGAAGSALSAPSLGVAVIQNFVGSSLTGSAAVGLPHDIDLTLTGGRHILGPTFDATAAWWPAKNPTLDLGVTLGLAGSFATADYNVETGTDADGNVISEARSVRYGTFAPSVGGRLVWKPSRIVSVPLALRGSYSWTIVSGSSESPSGAWLEAMTGAVVHLIPTGIDSARRPRTPDASGGVGASSEVPTYLLAPALPDAPGASRAARSEPAPVGITPHFDLGAGVGAIAGTYTPAPPSLVGSVSVAGTFDLPRKPR